jgi:hypothetical protein
VWFGGVLALVAADSPGEGGNGDDQAAERYRVEVLAAPLLSSAVQGGFNVGFQSWAIFSGEVPSGGVRRSGDRFGRCHCCPCRI